MPYYLKLNGEKYPSIDSLTSEIAKVRARFGNLPIVGGNVLDDSAIDRITVLDENDSETDDPKKAVSLFLG